MANQPLASTILDILKAAQSPLPTLQISKQAGFKTAKDVNPTLYALLASKQVEKIAEENGSNPRWSLPGDKNPSPLQTPTTNKLREEILTLLSKSTEALSPTCIRSQLEQPVPRAEINALLYSFLKEKLVVKTSNPDGTNPKWSLVGQ